MVHPVRVSKRIASGMRRKYIFGVGSHRSGRGRAEKFVTWVQIFRSGAGGAPTGVEDAAVLFELGFGFGLEGEIGELAGVVPMIVKFLAASLPFPADIAIARGADSAAGDVFVGDLREGCFFEGA